MAPQLIRTKYLNCKQKQKKRSSLLLKLPGNTEDWKHVYKTSKAIIIAQTCVYFLIFDVYEAEFFFKAKHTIQGCWRSNTSTFISQNACKLHWTLSTSKHFCWRWFLKLEKFITGMLKCNHSFEVTTNNNELQCWHFKSRKGKNLSLQKISHSLKFFPVFFSPDLYAPERQFQVLATQPLARVCIAHGHTETKPARKQQLLAKGRGNSLSWHLHQAMILFHTNL